MQNFHSVTLPNFISIWAKGGPSFSTSCAFTASGRERRKSERSDSLQHYIVSDCRLSMEQFNVFNSFFRARHGQQYSFKMRDHLDCVIENQIIEKEKTDQLYFEIYKLYKDDLMPYKRRITKLSKESSFINLNGDIDCDNGIITLEKPLLEGEQIILNALFDVTVRFMSDSLKYHLNIDGSIVIDNLEMIEVV